MCTAGFMKLMVWKVLCRFWCVCVCSAWNTKRLPSGQPAAPVSLFFISLSLFFQLFDTSFRNHISSVMQKGEVGWGETISRFLVPTIKASATQENLPLSNPGGTTWWKICPYPKLEKPLDAAAPKKLMKCLELTSYSRRTNLSVSFHSKIKGCTTT